MIRTERRGDVSVVRLDRPPVNAMDVELLRGLTDTLRGLDGPVVLTGAGRVFSAGVDLRRVLDEDEGYAGELLTALTAAFRAVFDHPAPTVAAINGSAIAGGCVLALACDVRLMAAGRIGLTELAVGVAYPRAAIEVARFVLGGRAAGVVLGARSYDVPRAVELGLVDEQVAPQDLVDRAVELAAGMAVSREAYAVVKAQLHEPVTAVLDRADDAEATALWASPATREHLRRQLESLRRP